MTALVEKARNEGFLLDEGNGDISRATIVLESGSVYESGSVVVKIAPATTYSLVTAAALTAAAEDEADVDVAIVARRTNAVAVDTKAGAIARLATVKDSELVLGASTTVAQVKALLETKSIVTRAAA